MYDIVEVKKYLSVNFPTSTVCLRVRLRVPCSRFMSDLMGSDFPLNPSPIPRRFDIIMKETYVVCNNIVDSLKGRKETVKTLYIFVWSF